MYDIKIIDEKHMDDAIKLSEYSFKYILKGEERQKRLDFMQDHLIFGVFDEDHMIAKTHIIPLEVIIDKKPYSMGGIASVATYPQYRRKGIVNELMKLSLEKMKEQKQILSFLHPFSMDFYRKYGYEIISNLKTIEIDVCDLNYFKGIEGKTIVPFSNENLDDINAVYMLYTEKYNSMLIRTNKWWKQNQFEACSPVIYYDKDNNPKGYMLFKIEEDTLEIAEYIYLDEESRRGLWNFIANHDSMIKKAKITMSDDEQMSFLFYNPVVKTEIIPYFMGRIVLAEEFLNKYTDFSALKEELTVYIQDDKALWNNGKYTLSNKGMRFESLSKEEVEKIKDHTKDIETDKKEVKLDTKKVTSALIMDINTLTTVLLGFQKADFLYGSGKIKGNSSQLEILKKIITSGYSSYLDYF